MPNIKISARTALTGANVDMAADVIGIVDTSVTTGKKILGEELAKALGSAVAASNLAATAAAGTGTLLSKVDHVHQRPVETIGVALGDETTAITTGTAKVSFRMPYAFTVTAVRASLTTASSSGTPTFDINESATTILSTKLTIDPNELTSTTAAVPAVVSDTALADDAEITIDVDVAGTSAAGAKIMIIGRQA